MNTNVKIKKKTIDEMVKKKKEKNIKRETKKTVN